MFSKRIGHHVTKIQFYVCIPGTGVEILTLTKVSTPDGLEYVLLMRHVK
jgi:hypothetical protein